MFLTSHIFVLIVALPLLAAPVAALLPWRRVSWGLTFASALTVLGLAIFLNIMTLKASPLSYDLGNWAPPIGIEYLADGLNAFILLLVSAIAVICLPFMWPDDLVEVEAHRQPLFFGMFLLCLAGLCGITMTNDIFNIYVFLEISSLATYTLIACGKSRKALLAAFEYLVLGTIGATFLLIGIGMLYMATGTLNISDLSHLLMPMNNSTIVNAGIAFIIIGLMMKVALFPLHSWLVQAYTYAPTPISAFLSATGTKVGLYLVIRILYGVFGPSWVFSSLPIDIILQVLGTAAVLVGSFAVLFQRDAKRMLAFSSVAQVGYVVFALSLGTSLGLSAALLHLFTHALAKAALFLGVVNIERKRGLTSLIIFPLISREMPITAVCITIAGLSLLGVPLTAGFLSKWLLLKSALDTSHWVFFGLLLVSTLATAVYMWKLLEPIWFGKGKPAKYVFPESPLWCLIPLCIVTFACLYFGLFSTTLVELLHSATATYFPTGDL